MKDIMLFKPLFKKQEELNDISQCLDISWANTCKRSFDILRVRFRF